METIDEQFDRLQHDVACMLSKVDNHPLFSQINEWEQESTIKIQVTAELARADLSLLLETNTNRLRADFDRISQQIQVTRSLNDSERSSNQCMSEIRKCREDISRIFDSVTLSSDPTADFVHFQKVTESDADYSTASNRRTTASIPADSLISTSTRSSGALSENAEKFGQTMGEVELAEHGLVAKKISALSASIRGAKLYSTGTHQIRFRVEQLSNNSIFIGISPSTQPMTTTAFQLPCTYGWWDTKFPVIGGVHVTSGGFSMHTGDEILLTLVCDETRLVYHNKRSGFGKISVNLSSCPLPWQLLVVLGSGENVIRILPWKQNN